MGVTMHDVAARAGVSIKTVSNVVNNYPYIRPATRARVEEAIAALGYQVNVSARNLRQGRTGMIGLAVPELRVPYFAELADSVLRAAEAQGLVLLIEQTGALGEHEAEVLRSPRRRFTDGLLFSPMAMDPADHPELEVDYPLVLLGERVFDAGVDHVTMANVAGAKAATQHLIERGCRNIAAVGAHPDDVMSSATLRFRGYREALDEAGLPFDPRHAGFAHRWVRSTGATAMAQVLDSGVPVDGVFAMNDALALGALHVLHARGLRVPEDVALIGFDNIDDTVYSEPPLSSIDPGREQIADQAVELLVARIAGSETPPQLVVADFELVERESTSL
jgi:DNA-binding LacI/PurR family transcriptional regulator